MSQGHINFSKSEIWEGLCCAMYSCCSDAEYAAELEDIPESGANFGSSYPPSFNHIYGLTDLNMEVILTNSSLLRYLCILEY